MLGTRSIFGLKRAVKSNCQAALFDGAVSLDHPSVKEKDGYQSQIQEWRGADLHEVSLSGRAKGVSAGLKTLHACLLGNKSCPD